RRTPTADELASARARGNALLLGIAVFDPLKGPLPAFVAGRTVTGGEGSFLVQFLQDLSAAERRDLEASGLRFVDYVPNHAYLVRASPEAFATLRSHPLVRWLDAFRGGYKL